MQNLVLDVVPQQGFSWDSKRSVSGHAQLEPGEWIYSLVS